MIDLLNNIGELIGNTPLHKLSLPDRNLYVKLESHNIFGSIKDRPAYFIMRNAIRKGFVNQNTIVIESTSGNFGIALAGICNTLKIKFIAVIDPNISKEKQQILELLCHRVIKVTKADHSGGYLLTRIAAVQAFCRETANAFNPNQYKNPDNYLSYYHTLGEEICSAFASLDFIFVSVSSCGTIIGLSRKLKEKFPDLKVIAVDVEGSLIFTDQPKERKISGIGAGLRSEFIDLGYIDDVIILKQEEIIAGCKELLNEHSLLLGASSGAAYFAARKYLSETDCPKGSHSLFISPDSGASYLNNIYSEDWVRQNIKPALNEILK
jgi:2,3-diaminopropionate biosynthesis protein SbnA